jgi:acyl-CoA reductase-like NAD-dependent aldehyde dehydrogenase
MVLMEDADLNLAIDSAIKVGFYNSGQAGASPKRIIVH